MSAFRWIALVLLGLALLTLIYALATMPSCSEMTGAGYCWGDR